MDPGVFKHVGFSHEGLCFKGANVASPCLFFQPPSEDVEKTWRVRESNECLNSLPPTKNDIDTEDMFFL